LRSLFAFGFHLIGNGGNLLVGHAKSGLKRLELRKNLPNQMH